MLCRPGERWSDSVRFALLGPGQTVEECGREVPGVVAWSTGQELGVARESRESRSRDSEASTRTSRLVRPCRMDAFSLVQIEVLLVLHSWVSIAICNLFSFQISNKCTLDQGPLHQEKASQVVKGRNHS